MNAKNFSLTFNTKFNDPYKSGTGLVHDKRDPIYEGQEEKIFTNKSKI